MISSELRGFHRNYVDFLGIRWISYELAGFHIDIVNLVAAGRGTAFKNLGKVTTQGLELRTSLLFSNIIYFIAKSFIWYGHIFESL